MTDTANATQQKKRSTQKQALKKAQSDITRYNTQWMPNHWDTVSLHIKSNPTINWISEFTYQSTHTSLPR